MPYDLSTVGKFVAFGYTFATHIEDPEQDPAFWLQPSSSLIPEETPISLPPGVDSVHIGVEPTLVLGDHLWRATPDEVEAAVDGVTVSIDVSAPEALPVGDSIDPAPGFALLPPDQIYKFSPGFRPVLTDPAVIEYSELVTRSIEGIVDGETRTVGTMGDMRFDPLALVAEVSRYVPLEPNDMIALGEGESPVVEAPCEVTGRIDEIGELNTRVLPA